jgi:hypothetical protein
MCLGKTSWWQKCAEEFVLLMVDREQREGKGEGERTGPKFSQGPTFSDPPPARF